MGVTISKETGTRTGGSGSLVLRVTGTVTYPDEIYAQSVSLELESGVEYQITGWVRSDAVDTFDPFVQLAEIGGTRTADISTPSGSSSWQEFDVTYTPSWDAYLRLGGFNGGAPSGDFWFEFDDVRVWKTADEASDPLLYWTEGNGATILKSTDDPFEGEQSLFVAILNDITRQDISIDERSSYVDEAFLMNDSGSGEIISRVLDRYEPA